ncbi:MAG TPA: molybdopterin-binding protein [Nitriliruptoraceae bacterium]|nr:molybdopterin-binding protein [Nitriliruptoraceae bacterium]
MPHPMHDAEHHDSRPLRGHAATVITSSDGVAHGTRDDASGARLADLLSGAGAIVADRVVVADEVAQIRAAITAAIDHGSRLVVITGGTGLGPRDVTPEAIAGVTGRAIPGLGEAMRAAGRRSTPMADLSRSMAATVGLALVIAVPGSPRGAVESLEAVLGLVPHILDLLAGDTEHADDIEPTDDTEPTDDGASDTTTRDADHGETIHHAHATVGTEVASGAAAQSARVDHDHPDHVHGPDCDLAHGVGDQPAAGTLMAVFASPLAATLLAWGRELGYDVVLVDPQRPATDGTDGLRVVADPGSADDATDVVVTDHHRDELADMLDVALDTPARFIGLMGTRRHEGPHVDPLRERGRGDDDLARITRPIGLDIGSRTPPEIAVATLADLIARRTGATP